MEYYPSHQLQLESYHDWRAYLTRFRWQWHCTFTFESGAQYFYAHRLFKKWLMRLIDGEKLRVGAYAISASRKGHFHFHILMIGKNKDGKSLFDCQPKRWEAAWKYFAKIHPVTDNFGICDYVALHFMGFKSSHTEVDSFNKSLLRQEMIRCRDGIDNFDGLFTSGNLIGS